MNGLYNTDEIFKLMDGFFDPSSSITDGDYIKKDYVKVNYTDIEDERRYEVIIPGYHKSELKILVYDSEKQIEVKYKNDTCEGEIKFDVPFEFDDVTASLENGILYITVTRWEDEDEPYEVEID